MKRKLLTKGTTSQNSDGRWIGSVWYLDETGERKRRNFSGKTQRDVKKKISAYIDEFEKSIIDTQETKKRLRESMQTWLEVFKFPSVEKTTYDRLECTAKHQVYPMLGDKVVGDITAADIKALLNKLMNDGYAYTTVKKVHNLLHDYFRYLTEEELIAKNPMTSAPMIKKANFMAAQNKENLPENQTVTIFTPEEIEKFKAECFRCWSNGKRIYQQAAAYIFMLNTMLGLLNSDIDLENRVLHLNRGVKEVARRDGTETTSGREVQVGKLKTASSKRDVPLNSTAVAMVEDLRRERYLGEETPLVSDENGDFTRPVNFRKRYYRILEAAGIEQKGLHSLRHTFATNLVNGIKQPGGTII